MADINSSLPVSGVSMPAWTGIGSALITNVVPVSGVNLAMTGSVAITSSVALTQTGSVAITSSAVLPVSGVNLAGSVAITSSVALVQTGSIAITSSALLPVSGQGIAPGGSGTDANFVWHPLRTGSATAGAPGLLLAEVLGSVAISSANFTGSVAITSSAVLPVSGVNLAGSVAITSSVALTQTGSVAITSSALLPVSGQGIAAGASGADATFVWHPLRTGSATAGAPGLLLAEILGSVALTSSTALTQTGSVAITSSAVLPVSGVNLAGSVAITSSTTLTQTGSVAITSSTVLGVSGVNLAGSFAITNYTNWGGVGSVFVANTQAVQVYWGGVGGSRIYNTSASVAAGGSAVWFYSPAAAADIQRIKFTASGRIKAIFGVGSPALTTAEVGFNSTAEPNVWFDVGHEIAASSFLQLVCINNDAASMDLYSTIYATY